VTVVRPNGEESWTSGTVQTIVWSHNVGAGALMKIELSRDGGRTWKVLNAAAPSETRTQGTWAWPIRDNVTVQARVRVTAVGAGVTDTSDSSFRIGLGH
jgi:hypothetical protein